MSVQRVHAFLEQYGLGQRLKEFAVSSATVQLAAAAAGVEEARIAKTLSFRLADGSPILVVCAGDARIDNPRYKQQFGSKARMLAADEVEAELSQAVGGVCPFAVREGLPVYLDTSLKRFETVFPSGGSASSAVEISPEELELVTGGEWVTVCKL